ncbi:two-component regulator propeller domain-containing protein [Carboxylicivirga sp. N1Y90]|uniref:two-component regulator propeller domain-containing protein n=1 Tax=Carboxylicivirga fragile TaxID=3417571 RepID=UPI003D32D9FA|nr:response regulator [Marinilabiliaceae bacterium N1Y90]
MKIRFSIYIIITLYTYTAQGAEKYFSSLRYENGLPSNVTNSIVQDQKGFIWIGTENGLCRYDGYTMIYFDSQNSKSQLPSDRISALLLDDDILWVGTWNKLCTINIKTFEVNTFQQIDIRVIRTLFKDSNENIWVGTNDGLFKFNKDTQSFINYRKDNSNLSHNTVRSIYEDKDGQLWVGTFDGLNCLRGNRFDSFKLNGTYKPNISNNLILTIKTDTNNDSILLIGTETGLCLYNRHTGLFRNYNSENSALSNEVIKSIHQSSNELWLGTDFGLNIFSYKDSSITSFFHNPHINHTICNNVVRQIFEDQNALLWFVTPNGISILDNMDRGYSMNEVLFESNGIKAGNLLRDILVLNDGSKWMATDHGVIHETKNGQQELYTSKGERSRRLLLDNAYTLALDTLGQIWIGTAGGINIWNPNTHSMSNITSQAINGLTSNYIGNFSMSSEGQIYVSAWEGGVFKIVKNKDKKQPYSFISVTTNGEALMCVSNGFLYFTDNGALKRYDPKNGQTIKLMHSKDTGLNSPILSLQKAKNNQIWLAFNKGLVQFNTNNHTFITHRFHAPIAPIISMEIDKQGFIWAATPHEIIKIDSETSLLFTIPLNTNTPFKNFISKSSYQANDGQLYFGCQNGYLQIEPPLNYSVNQDVHTIISGLSINNAITLPNDSNQILDKDISYCEDIRLPYRENSLLFQFSNFDYWLPELNSYRYRLEGYNEQWQYTGGNKNFAVFSNLKPNNYTLEVSGTNHKGIASGSTSRIHFTIEPPIWLSAPFLILYMLVIIGIIYTAFYIYNFRNKLRNQLNIIQIEKEHSEQLFSNKQQFFTNISHEFRTPLSLILPPIRQILNSGNVDEVSKRMLQLAEKNSQRLMNLVNQILDFRKLETTGLKIKTTPANISLIARDVFESFNDLARRKDINYKFEEEAPSLNLAIDDEKIKTILFNLLSNAFKHTPAKGNISLKLKILNGLAKITVSDSGKGIDPAEHNQIFERFYQSPGNSPEMSGTGIGLTLAMEYARLHQGTITLESNLGKGSCFTLELPISSIDETAIEFNSITNKDTVPIRTTPSSTSNMVGKNRPKILLADDNPDILEFIDMNLRSNYKIIMVNNGVEALKLAISEQPTLIISDVMMPEMNGHELCRQLKSNSKTMHIPVLLLTAQSQTSQQILGMKSGADMYITKPFEIDYLALCIKNTLKREAYLINYSKSIITLTLNETSEEEKNQDTRFVKRVMTIIEENIMNTSFSVEKLAESMNISPTHLYRKLKALTGQSTQDIIKLYRLEKAANMLTNKEGNITEVMYQVGFSSLPSFSKAFKSHFGKSPSEYIKKNQDDLTATKPLPKIPK